MKKKLLSFGILGIILITLSSCGGTSVDNQDSAAEKIAKEIGEKIVGNEYYLVPPGTQLYWEPSYSAGVQDKTNMETLLPVSNYSIDEGFNLWVNILKGDFSLWVPVVGPYNDQSAIYDSGNEIDTDTDAEYNGEAYSSETGNQLLIEQQTIYDAILSNKYYENILGHTTLNIGDQYGQLIEIPNDLNFFCYENMPEAAIRIGYYRVTDENGNTNIIKNCEEVQVIMSDIIPDFGAFYPDIKIWEQGGFGQILLNNGEVVIGTQFSDSLTALIKIELTEQNDMIDPSSKVTMYLQLPN